MRAPGVLDAPLVGVGDQAPQLQFSADGGLLRVATATRLAIYDTSSRRLTGSADYPPDLGEPSAIFASSDDKQVRVVFAHAVLVHDGATASVVDSRTYKDDRTIVAQSRDLLVVVDGIEERARKAPLTVRDAKGAPAGVLAMARPNIGFGVHPVAICPGVDRAVGFAEGQLFVMSLPSGAGERTFVLVPADQANVECAPGGRVAAAQLGDAVYLLPISMGGRPPVVAPKAACDKGLASAPTDPETRRMLFYNAGRVAEHAGDFTKARAYYKQSLDIRDVAEVRSHLRTVERR